MSGSVNVGFATVGRGRFLGLRRRNAKVKGMLFPEGKGGLGWNVGLREGFADVGRVLL